ncbi:MAG: hypothetical protein KF744_01380 [Taibaiella sp.]|nr:hypothetical protein [Taibaiella sp.]
MLLVILLAGTRVAKAQAFSTGAQQSESFFLYEVKLIDEFIERFNDDPQSYIRTQSRAVLGTDSMITRRRMIRSLFDKKMHWGADVDRFIQQVCNNDLYLSISDSTWHARAVCLFGIDNKTVKVPVTLQIARDNGGLKWVVSSVDGGNLPATSFVAPVKKGASDFIPTSAHGTNFLQLQYVFSPGQAVTGYFSAQALSSPAVTRLLALIAQGKAKFSRVADVSYQFATIPGWQFTVEQRKRKETNSGWLITKLNAATER